LFLEEQVAVESFLNQLMKYSSGPVGGDSGSPASRVAADSATHEDFQAAMKSAGFSLEDVVQQVISI
jgi:hypothetical protein